MTRKIAPLLVFALGSLLFGLVQAGDLEPPASPSPTMVTLQEIYDGVVQINQSSALQGGVTPGDTAGFPVTISESGSYRLTGNLDLTAESTSRSGISITTDNVTIDLNGFSILGQTVCSGLPVTTCTITGSGSGIAGSSENIKVENGTIRGMPGYGVTLTGSGTQVIGVRAISNGEDGIRAGGLVERCIANQNRLDGIVSASRIQHNNVRGNGEDGINTSHSLVLQNHVVANGAFALMTSNTIVGYGLNVFECNNSGGLCTNAQQVSHANALEIGANVCGTDVACP